MKKVLVLTRNFRGVELGFGKEFEEKNCVVKTVVSEVYCSKWNIVFRIKNRLGLSNEKYMERKDKKFAKKIIRICNEFRPDIIYVCHGTQLRAETVDKLKEKYYLVADLLDRLEFFPALKECVPHYDYVYSYIKEDCELLSKQGVKCIFLPSLGNSNIFHPTNDEKDIDISFIGATYPEEFYGDRLEIINRLIDDFPEKKIKICGECAPIRRPEKFVKWLFNKKKRRAFNNKNISAYQCNNIYNRSKICLNINRINTGDGWSERFGNIAFTGSFQIITYSPLIEREFGKCVETFKDYDELRNKIELYLNNDVLRESKAEEAYNLYLKKVQDMNRELNLVDDVLDKCSEAKV